MLFRSQKLQTIICQVSLTERLNICKSFVTSQEFYSQTVIMSFAITESYFIDLLCKSISSGLDMNSSGEKHVLNKIWPPTFLKVTELWAK